jgi:TetR/AcrR family transcriptional regulator, mexJK operon transcriptional repressor
MEKDALHPEELPANTEQALICYGIRLMTQLMSPRLVAFERNLASELVRHPDLARRFYDAGPGQSRATLAAIIQSPVGRNELAVEHPMQAAADLYGLWHGFHSIEAHFGIVESPTETEIEGLVRTGVTRFMKAYRI